MDLTPIAIPVTLHRYLRALLAGGICWLGIPLPGQATVDMASSPGLAVGDPLYAEVARIEQYGTQYVLTSYCHGTHSIYVQPTSDIDLRDYAGQYVRVTYEQIKVQQADIRCVRAPCGPVTVTKAFILKLERIDMSEADLEESRKTCSQP